MPNEYRVEIRFPESHLKLTGKSEQVPNWDGELDLDDSSYLEARTRSRVEEMVRAVEDHLNSVLKATLIVAGRGTIIPISIELKPVISVKVPDSRTLKAKAVKGVKIPFGGNYHKILVLLTKQPVLYGWDNLAIAKMRTLGLIGLKRSEVAITERGRQVLDELRSVGPPKGEKGLGMLSQSLLTIHSWPVDKKFEPGPYDDWSKTNNLVHYEISSHNKFRGMRLTEKGIKWLEERYEFLEEHFGQGRNWWARIVEFAPKEALPQYLANKSEGVRKAAKKRLEQLERREGN